MIVVASLHDFLIRSPYAFYFSVKKSMLCRAFTIDVVLYRCNGRNVCSVTVNDELFGDPCPKTKKYLELKYDCTDVAGTIYLIFKSSLRSSLRVWLFCDFF